MAENPLVHYGCGIERVLRNRRVPPVHAVNPAQNADVIVYAWKKGRSKRSLVSFPTDKITFRNTFTRDQRVLQPRPRPLNFFGNLDSSDSSSTMKSWANILIIRGFYFCRYLTEINIAASFLHLEILIFYK